MKLSRRERERGRERREKEGERGREGDVALMPITA